MAYDDTSTLDSGGLLNPNMLFNPLPGPRRADILAAMLRGQPVPQRPGFIGPPVDPNEGSPSANLPSSAPGRPVSRPAPQPQAMPQAMPRQVAQPEGGQYVQRPTNPLDTSDIDARNAELTKQQQAIEQQITEASKAPDASMLEDLRGKRNEKAGRYLMLALAAQRAGPGMEAISQDFMKRSAAESEPMKMTGGTLTSEGWAQDPGYLQQQIIKGHEARIASIDRALQANLAIGERRRLEQAKMESEAALRNAMLGVQQSIAQQASLDRRYGIDVASADRQAALDAKGAGSGQVPPQALLDLAAEARKYIPTATSSGAGELRDKTAAFFNQSTQGAQAAARLNVIGGMLVSAQPKMSGPQSDRDVLLYRQMAGDVANAGLPSATRLAALSTIEDLARKYQTGEYTPVTAPKGGGLPRARAAAAAPPAAGAAPGEVDFSSLPTGR